MIKKTRIHSNISETVFAIEKIEDIWALQRWLMHREQFEASLKAGGGSWETLGFNWIRAADLHRNRVIQRYPGLQHLLHKIHKNPKSWGR